MALKKEKHKKYHVACFGIKQKSVILVLPRGSDLEADRGNDECTA